MPQQRPSAPPQLDSELGLRPAGERGHSRTDWLDSRHSFSFGGYMDPRWMGFGPLRVINDDRIAPGSGFPEHGHRNMEILTLVLTGALEHRDSTGGGGVLRPGSAQLMSAGRGIQHSEFNASDREPARFLQIWLEPTRSGTEPRYHERDFGDGDRGAWCLVASPDGELQSLPLGVDARVHTAQLEAGGRLGYELASGRRLWLQVASGSVTAGDRHLAEGDGLFSRGLGGMGLELTAHTPAKLVLFDLS